MTVPMAIVNQNPTSGSIGNVTNSRGRSGQIQRRRSIPTNPNSAAQSAARSRLTTQAAAWRGLTDAQRAAWNAFAASFTVTNALGASINLTGMQCFVKVNCTNVLLGDAPVTTPPALPAFAANTCTSVTAAAGTAALDVNGTTPVSPCKYMMFASPQRSAGVSYENDFRYLASFTTATSSKFSLLSAYTAKFGALIAGKKIFVKVVQSLNGMQDNGTTFAAIVAA
jgi:hypothetical protein